MAGLHQSGENFRLRLAQMNVTAGNAAVKQGEEIPLFQIAVHHIAGNVGQIIQPVARQFQLAHGLDGGLFGAQHAFPFLDDGANLKHPVHAGGVFQHDAVGLRAGDNAPVKVLPFLAAKGQVVHNVLGALVGKPLHQKIFGVEVHHNAA